MAHALRALSSTYVERRRGLGTGAALAGAGKRAAFALFYGPLHYLLTCEIVRALPGATGLPGPDLDSAGDAPGIPRSRGQVRYAQVRPRAVVIDLGCGSGASGAAWAVQVEQPARVLGIDRHPWVLEEAAWTYQAFDLAARTRRRDVTAGSLPRPPALVLAAFLMNELPPPRRDVLLGRLLDRAAGGDRVLIVEPIARSVAHWWGRWADAFESAGGRADEWRFRVELPPLVARLDRAAGLDHGELTARSIWIARGTQQRTRHQARHLAHSTWHPAPRTN